ncbi:leader peptidase (prepilin peptidase)/N-methyltransferase [Microbacterium sp. SORGH_AS428]|uniref:A24 family peptidase n=1 Tax=Microbacterium sp. SORGH_AS_0428 TaxID=3041788 RepID=UPI00285F3C0B|nr:A24 family peptidase [Microbacterium sp. SORGH_AS_0428]MDR6198714.1 leader peptidase (prepilin peptidase)/N-methyltransferase [Microbacterium sp. SORGH_AS_0428]
MDPAGLALLVAYGTLAILSVVLAVIDVRTHRLPNALVLPAYPFLLAALALASIGRADMVPFLQAVAGGAIAFVFYLLLRLVQPRGMGGGDVKLAGLLGIALGYLGWDALLLGLFAGFLLGGLFSVGLLLSRRGSRRTRIPFGPWMLLGAWTVIGLIALA